MTVLRVLTAAEQVADHLRYEIAHGVWTHTMPGNARLMRELGVGRATVDAALILLEEEGLLVPQGVGRRRKIELPEGMTATGMQVRILLFNKGDENSPAALQLMQSLNAAGHAPEFASSKLWSMGMDQERVARFVKRNPADAWVVVAGSREVLEWFASQSIPCFGLLGGFRGTGVAGAKPDKVLAQRQALQRLAKLGHQRIVKIVLKDRLQPTRGHLEQSFLDELESLEISSSSYNLAGWANSIDDFYKVLDAIFAHTPPTALFLDAVSLFHAARDHLARKGIQAPRDVSLICNDPDESFKWMQPSVAHIDWSFEPLTRRVVRWLDNVAAGRDDRRKSLIKAQFVDGETVGKAPAEG